jgi:hypothetical protein
MSEGYSNVDVTEEGGCIVLVFTDPLQPTVRVRMSVEQSRTMMERIRGGLASGDTNIGVVEVLEASVDRKPDA